MNALFVAASMSVFFFDLSGKMHPIKPDQEVTIEHNRIWIVPRPLGPVEVIDSKGRNVVVGIDGNVVNMKAKERSGYRCGPITVRVGGEEFKFRIRPHHTSVCEDHH